MSSKFQIKLINDEFIRLIKQRYDNLILNLEYNTFIHNIEAFPNVIPENTLIDIKNKQKIFGIYVADEGVTEYVENIYTKLVIGCNIPASQILLICSSPDYKQLIISVANKYNLDNIKCVWISVFEHQQKQLFLWYLTGNNFTSIEDRILPYKSSLENKKFNKKFLCFNRRWKEFRLATAILLNNRQLLEQSYYSYPNSPVMTDDLYFGKADAFDKLLEDTVKLYKDLEKELSEGYKLKEKLPLVIDNKAFQTYFAFDSSHRMLIKYFRETYFTLVTETLYDNGNIRFLTEKLFKPIMHKHPFILVSTPYSLELLREQGYKTFNGIIDESYDSETNDNLRLLKIISEVERLCNLNEVQLQEFLEQALPIVEHNYKIFFQKQIQVTTLL